MRAPASPAAAGRRRRSRRGTASRRFFWSRAGANDARAGRWVPAMRRNGTRDGNSFQRFDAEMRREHLLVVDAVANEKGLPESVILEAIEAALATAAKKRYAEEDVLTRVSIDAKDGSYETFRRWEVVADDVVMESPDRQIRLMDAVDEVEGVEVGDYIEEQIENVDFGRIAAQAAKQVIVQRVREAERQQVVDAWKERISELVTGVVKRVERGNVYVDLGGNAEAFIP